MSETYQGNRRGRDTMGDMSFDMFPEKYESTHILEDDDQVEHDQRATIADFGPEQGNLFAHEEPRRVTYAKHNLLLRQTGEFSTTTPWISHGDFDTSFTDADPRGYLTEQPWHEYRRQQEANIRRIDYKDDGDYSTTSGHINPFSMFKNIRSAQDWVKARLKVFDTSYEGRSNGGVGVYAHTSNVYKSSAEDTSVQTDGDSGMATTFEDPENRQRLTMKLSNIIHQGSAALRANSTTDHKVPVAAYGKLYSNAGLINHEAQMRLIQDDTPLSRLEGMKLTPRNLVKMMSSYVNSANYANGDYGDYTRLKNDVTAVSGARRMGQDATGDVEKFAGMRGDSETLDNRSIMLTRDILSLLGITENEVKFADSYSATNSTQAKLLLANMYQLAEVVHKLPANVKLEMRNELLLRSSGGSLKPGTASQLRRVQGDVVVNPKIVTHMALSTKKGKVPENIRMAMDHVEGDPVGHRRPLATPILSYRSFAKSAEDISMNRSSGEAEQRKFGQAGITALADKAVKNYSAMAAIGAELNRVQGLNDQILHDTEAAKYGRNQRNTENDFHTNLVSTVLDVNFGENKGLRRGAKRAGTKSMRRHVTSDYHTVDQTLEMGNTTVKNPTNRTAGTR